MESFEVLRLLSLIVVWFIPSILILILLLFIMLMPACALGGLINRLYTSILDYGFYCKIKTKLVKNIPSESICSVDSDCPPGYVCMNGRCILRGT